MATAIRQSPQVKDLGYWVEQLSAQAAHCETSCPAVSGGSVGWHIAHSFLTIHVIVDALQGSRPGDYKWSFNWKRALVYGLGRIPRGRAKAPRAVRPPEQHSAASLEAQGAAVLEKIKILDGLPSNHFFRHPYFGLLNLRPSKRFLVMHTKHHFSIVQDILQQKK